MTVAKHSAVPSRRSAPRRRLPAVFPHNPYTPGAGHAPPYLAGREEAQRNFARLLAASCVGGNVILPGAHGVGKTVLLNALRPVAAGVGWRWTGSDLSGAAGVTEDKLAQRLITDLALVTPLPAGALAETFQRAQGVLPDKLKAVLERGWKALERRCAGVVFAYDGVQALIHGGGNRHDSPLVLALEVFRSAQGRGLPLRLVLTGLPGLRAVLERRRAAAGMFQVLPVEPLDQDASRDAICKPLRKMPVSFDDALVDQILDCSGGYPCFLQFICREAFARRAAEPSSPVPMAPILGKLDQDFFTAPWERITCRQRDLLRVVAHLGGAGETFTVRGIERKCPDVLRKPFSGSHITQILNVLIRDGLASRHCHGRYALTMPQLVPFIRRKTEPGVAA